MKTPNTASPEMSRGMTNPKAPFPWSIGITSVFVLFLMVLAIAVPEYWKYKFQMSQLELQTKQLVFQQDQEKKRAEKQDSSAPPSASQQPVTVKSESISQSPAMQSETKPGPISVDSSALFDSYGRFITLLVGLISVIGIFFGYFVKKSIHETEESMGAKIDKILIDWKEEKGRIEKNYETQSNMLTQKLGEVTSLKDEVSSLKERLREYLDEYETSKQEYTEGPAPPTQDPTSVAQALDQAFSTEGQPPPVKSAEASDRNDHEGE